jgi:hypothetical protein
MRKHPKMKVSLRRKIHIIALPQDTSRNTRRSADQSAAMSRQACGPTGPAGADLSWACSSV